MEARQMARTVGFIGSGTLANVLIKGMIKAGSARAEDIVASDVDADRLSRLVEETGIRAARSNKAVVDAAGVLFLTVKPQVIDCVVDEVSRHVRADQLVVSPVAGVTTESLESAFPRRPRILRIMPNTPCLVMEGVIAVSIGRHAGPKDVTELSELLAPLGKIVTVQEDLMDSVTALSGSGPAFVYTMIEALADGGVRVGFSRSVALQLAAQTVLGAAKMVLETGSHPACLRDMVTSPGGTAIAGLHALERGSLRASIMDAVVAAAERSKELGQILAEERKKARELLA
ncbi:MAG TPA: pyrroline-5-carboxylate reductase [Firmicutes bacterium]|nr:pyrroline-5-carboxylate reductase [Bacillota bacterium]